MLLTPTGRTPTSIVSVSLNHIAAACALCALATRMQLAYDTTCSMPCTQLPRSQWLRQPWANGLGVTWELARAPDDDQPFAWRISVAELPAHSTFSNLPGVARLLCVRRGRVELTINEQTHVLAPGDCVRFSGDDHVTSAGAGEDINVMWRGGYDVSARTLREGQHHAPLPGTRVLVVAIASCTLIGAQHTLLADELQDAAWLSEPFSLARGVALAIDCPLETLATNSRAS